MIKRILIVFAGIFIGVLGGFFVLTSQVAPIKSIEPSISKFLPIINPLAKKREVIGFLPYWLLVKADKDYSKYVTTFTYFGLTIDKDGTILKLNNPQEAEPGWHALKSGKLDNFFENAKNKNIELSLLVFKGNPVTIEELISDPKSHAKNLTDEVIPIMKKYGFTDLNVDIESTKEATDGARLNFKIFLSEIKKSLETQKAGTLTIDVSGDDLIKKKMIDLKSLSTIPDKVVIMGYDYHYSGSFVTGPVAPLFGAGTVSEYDVQTAVKKALEDVPPEKIILGIPLYGYQWETIDNIPRSPIIPGSGLVSSVRRMDQFMEECSTCSAQFDNTAKESFLIYKDNATDTYYQTFFPNKESTLEKTNFAKNNNLGGLALWALGYEDNQILEPLINF